MTGIWGTRVANETARHADVILAVGTAFGEADCSSWNPKYTFAIPPSKLIQIDIDPQEIGKIYPVDVGIVGDAKATLRELAGALRGARGEAATPRARAAIATGKAEWQRELAHGAAQRRQADPSGAPAERDLEGRAGRHDLRHRRRLEQERRGAAAGRAAPAVVHHQRRHGDDGVRAGGGDRRQDRRARQAGASAWSATAASCRSSAR